MSTKKIFWGNFVILQFFLKRFVILYSAPNNESPLNTQAAQLWENQEGKFCVQNVGK